MAVVDRGLSKLPVALRKFRTMQSGVKSPRNKTVAQISTCCTNKQKTMEARGCDGSNIN